MSGGWSLYIIVLTVSTIAAALWLLFWQRKKRVEKGQTLGHEFDGIQELDNPLPRWWLGLYVGTVAFSVAYLVLYPGLVSFAGVLGWTQRGQYDGGQRRGGNGRPARARSLFRVRKARGGDGPCLRPPA